MRAVVVVLGAVETWLADAGVDSAEAVARGSPYTRGRPRLDRGRVAVIDSLRLELEWGESGDRRGFERRRRRPRRSRAGVALVGGSGALALALSIVAGRQFAGTSFPALVG